MRRTTTTLALLAALFGFTTAAPAQGLAADSSCHAVVTLTHAQRTVMQGERVIDSAQVSLPDRIPRAWRGPGFTLRYRLDLGACDSQSVRRAILFSRVGGPYRVLADGRAPEPVRIEAQGSGGPYNGRVGGVFALDNAVAQVEVQLLTLPNVGGGLIRVAAGPQAPLLAGPALAHHRWQQFSLLSSVVLGLAGLLGLAIWLARRQDHQALWFAGACLMWSFRGQFLQVFSLPLDALLYEQINPMLIWFSALLVGTSSLASVNGLTRRRAWSFAALGVLAVLGFAVSMAVPSLLAPYRLLAFAIGFGMLLWILVLLLRSARAFQRGHVRWLLLGYGFVMVGASHDFLMILGLLEPGWWTLLTPGFTLLLLCHMVSVSLYLLRNLRRAERANLELERTISDKTQELQSSYASRQALELINAREVTLAAERERMNREMHDGLGAQLITALRGVERDAFSKEQVAQLLQDGLDELRLLMDVSDLGRSLHGALAAWRNHWDARLQAVGVALHWQVDAALERLQLSSDATLHVMRVLQEAVANIVKHAQASQITVSAARQTGHLVLEIVDNGVGLTIDPAKPSTGRGLGNMHQRAERLGAQLQMEKLAAPQQGTRVRLSLPWTEPA